MALYMNNTKVKSVYWNGAKAKKVYFNNVLVLSGGEFAFTYTGAYAVEGDLGGNFVIRFKTSGTLTITDAGNAASLDVFLVGGGGGGGNSAYAGGGGGGGYTKTIKSTPINVNATYSIAVGAGGAGHPAQDVAGISGGNTSAFGNIANGGVGGGNGTGGHALLEGGAGGSGGGAGVSGRVSVNNFSRPNGSGGSDGGNGYGENKLSQGYAGAPGQGQGTTTKEFGEASGKLYSGGGGGSIVPKGTEVSSPDLANCNIGGAGGGGNGAVLNNPPGNRGPSDGGANTGGGGGGSWRGHSNNVGNGGSGIVCIRNHR